MNGFLVVDKPPFITSHDVVDRVRRFFKEKKVGHTGTLDPMATGVLVLALGKATRLSRFLKLEPKTYLAEITFGIETDTLDSTGKVVCEKKVSLNEEEVEEGLNRFLGRVMQIPPMTSAIKKNGVPLYVLARKGLEVERTPREVFFYRLELLKLELGDNPKATIRVESSKGAYIRVLAADLGKALGTVAHLSGLRRLSCGSFSLEQAHTLKELKALRDEGRLEEVLIPLNEGLSHCPKVILKNSFTYKVKRGQPPNLAMISKKPFNLKNGVVVRLVESSGELLAVARWQGEFVYDLRQPVAKLEVVLAN